MSTQRRSTRRGLFFAGLYLCEGAPIGFLWWALPTILRERGASLEYIGSLASWLVLPWALKFLWAPFFDTRQDLGRWISGAQLLMAASLLPLLTLDPAGAMGWLTAALVVHAFAAASQDAAIDALAIRTTPAGERGRLNGWMQVGMLLGRSLFGGGALLARRWIGDEGLVLLLSGGLLTAALGMKLRAPLLFGVAGVSNTPVWRRLAAALRERSTWLGLVFAATSGAGFESVGVLAGPLLIDHGLDSKAVGLFFGVPVVVAMAVGAVLGGQASDRFGVRRTVLLSGLYLGGCVLSLAWLAHGGAAPTVLLAVLSCVYFGIGLFTASSYALFMALTKKSLGATQFSAFMGATNLCESWSARWGGALAENRGYSSAFALPALAALAALPLLLGLRPNSHEDESIA